MIKILVVEDDDNLRYIIKGGLEDVIGGYEVITASSGEEGLTKWREHQPKVIVADVEMSGMNGFEMVAKIRETDIQTLIIFASAKVSPKDVTSGYKTGGNNYIKKPFIPEELDVHIKAMIKLREELTFKNENEIKKIGSYTFDTINMTLKKANGEMIALTQREALLLRMLVLNKEEVVKRNTILEMLWQTEGADYFASRSLDVFINSLRKKLADDPDVQIKTVKGIGVCLTDN